MVFGGRPLTQTVIAATRTVPDKELLSLHTVFARGGNFDEPLKIDVEVMASGRSMASLMPRTTCRGASVVGTEKLDGDVLVLARVGAAR